MKCLLCVLLLFVLLLSFAEAHPEERPPDDPVVRQYDTKADNCHHHVYADGDSSEFFLDAMMKDHPNYRPTYEQDAVAPEPEPEREPEPIPDPEPPVVVAPPMTVPDPPASSMPVSTPVVMPESDPPQIPETPKSEPEKKEEKPEPRPAVEILNVEYFENPDRLIVTLRNNMETPFLLCEGLGKFELRRSNGKVLSSSMFRHVNLTFKRTAPPVLVSGETVRVYVASVAVYNDLIPLYRQEDVKHYIHLGCVDYYNPRQSLVLYGSENGKFVKLDEYPRPVQGAPRLLRKKAVIWGALKQ